MYAAVAKAFNQRRREVDDSTDNDPNCGSHDPGAPDLEVRKDLERLSLFPDLVLRADHVLGGSPCSADFFFARQPPGVVRRVGDKYEEDDADYEIEDTAEEEV